MVVVATEEGVEGGGISMVVIVTGIDEDGDAKNGDVNVVEAARDGILLTRGASAVSNLVGAR